MKMYCCKTIKFKSYQSILISFLIILSISFFSSCLDKIDFTRPEGDLRELVIQGTLVKGDPNVVHVRITNIFDQSGLVNPKRISVNEVIVSNDKGQSKTLKENGRGDYIIQIFDNDPSFTIDFQTSYKVFVRTINGEEYESTFDSMDKVPIMELIDVKKITKQIFNDKLDRLLDIPYLQFTINTPLFAPNELDKPNLRWVFKETYKFTDSPRRFNAVPKTCFITENAKLTNLVLINGEEMDTDRLDNFLVYEREVASQLAEGYYLTIIQQTLSPSAYDYWAQVKEITTKTGSMFESPAGTLITNFKTTNEAARPVTGYFYASQADTLRLYISPDFVDNPQRFCPPPIATFGCDLCCDCLQHSGGTITKPAFWVE